MRLTKEERRLNRQILIKNILLYKMVEDWEINRITGTVRVKRQFTRNSAEDLHYWGYLRASKWIDTLCGAGMPIFVKFHNFVEADPGDNRETSTTLRDYLESDIDKKMKTGFTRLGLDLLDAKSLGMVAVVGAGVVIGLYLLMGGM